jgi:hypothetical protein
MQRNVGIMPIIQAIQYSHNYNYNCNRNIIAQPAAAADLAKAQRENAGL